MVLKITVISAFALTIIITGILGMRRTRTFHDFFLGGGKVGPILTAFTYGTAYFSAVLFIGFAGKIGWSFGYSGLWISLGNALVGVLCVWLFIGPKIKKISEHYQIHTMSEYLEKRYHSPFLKLFAAICIFIFFIPYCSAVFIGLSYLFRSTFGIDYTLALISMGLFTAVYLVMGGYKSMTMIDFVFGMIMVVGVIILLSNTISQGNGLTSITTTLSNMDPKLTKAVGPPGLWPLFSLVFLTSIAPFAMPQLIQKFYAIKDKKAIKIGVVASTFFAILITGIGYFVGATTRVFLSPEKTPNAFIDGKPIFDALIPELLTNVIPEGLSVLILLLILSASMSTLAALVLISSSAITKDLYAGFINKNPTDKRLTSLMRLCSAFFVLLSVVMAYFKPSTIVAILGISWGAIGSVFLGPFLWGLFTKWVNRTGAIAGAAIALIVCLLLYINGMPSPQAGTIGMITSLVITPIIGAFSKICSR